MTGWRKRALPLEMTVPAPKPAAQRKPGAEDPFETVDGRLEIVTEPVFRGQAAVYEAGMEHEMSVVLIHGVGSSGMMDWRHVIPLLAEKYHVVAFDLPGFGRSSRQNALYSPEGYADFVCWTVRQYVKGPFAVVGHSLGGAIALRYAATAPEGLQRLIVADAAGILHRVALSKSLLRLGGAGAKGGRLKKSTEKLNDFTGALLDAMDRESAGKSIEQLLADPLLRRTVLGGSPARIASLALIADDFSAALDRVRVPALIIWGGHDCVSPLRTAAILEARLPAARLALIGNAGHSPMLEQPQQFNDLLLAELAQQGAVVPKPAVSDSAAGRTGVCTGKNGMRFSGDYASITLTDCTAVEIRNATVGSIEVSGSEAVIENSSIMSGQTGLKAFRSELTLTNVDVNGIVAIEASRSRLDLAGVRLEGRKASMVVEKESIFVFSVSRAASPLRTGSVHGSFKLAGTAY